MSPHCYEHVLKCEKERSKYEQIAVQYFFVWQLAKSILAVFRDDDVYHSLLDFSGNAHHLTWTTDIDMLTLKPSYPEAKSLKKEVPKMFVFGDVSVNCIS